MACSIFMAYIMSNVVPDATVCPGEARMSIIVPFMGATNPASRSSVASSEANMGFVSISNAVSLEKIEILPSL